MCAGHAIVGVKEMPALMAVMAALELISIMSNATTKSEPTDSNKPTRERTSNRSRGVTRPTYEKDEDRDQHEG